MAGGGSNDGNAASSVAEAKPCAVRLLVMPPGCLLRSADDSRPILSCGDSIIRKQEKRWKEGEEEWWGVLGTLQASTCVISCT